MAKKEEKKCCMGGGFPTFPVILLVIGVLWILSDIGWVTISIPWVPVVLVVVAIGWIANSKKKGK